MSDPMDDLPELPSVSSEAEEKSVEKSKPMEPHVDEGPVDLVVDCLGASSGYVFPGIDGIPFRHNRKVAPDIKEGDPVQPTVVMDAKVKVLNLGDEADMKRYQFVWSQISKGRCELSREEMEYDPDTKNWRVFIRYGVRWLEMQEQPR